MEEKSLPKGLTAEKVTELKSKFDEILLLDNGDAAVIVRQPRRMEWERFQQIVQEDPKKRHRAIETLLSDCTVWPEPTALDELFDRRPAYIMKFGLQLIAFAAGENDVEKKAV
jgi:hypothetical protein